MAYGRFTSVRSAVRLFVRMIFPYTNSVTDAERKSKMDDKERIELKSDISRLQIINNCLREQIRLNNKEIDRLTERLEKENEK